MHKQATFQSQLEDRQQLDQEARKLLQDGGLQFGALDKLETRENQLRNRFVKKVRPPLADAPLTDEQRIRDRWFQSRINQPALQAATLVGADTFSFANGEGEPTTVWFDDTEKIDNLKNSMSGSGWGCFVKENPNYPDEMVTWWYLWVPPAEGSYWFWVVSAYAGFYIVKANDGYFNCKYAKAHAFTEVDVYQYFWHGQETRTIIDKRDDNINEAGRVSGSVHFNFSRSLGAGDVMAVKVTTTLDVYAQGSGSYAELNFNDGEGNYLRAPLVFISKT